jgi:creatinine amidohydrolase/Fe(II)-dependent formamide hydrolase-like protein
MTFSISRTLLAAAVTAAVSTAAFAQVSPNDGKSMGGGDCAKNKYNCTDTANPLPKADTVWLEKMTWMDVRDAMKAGKKTIIIPTGGIEPNGPWLTLGKHNWVLETNCEAIAKALGDALCAPVVKFVPEGGIEPKTGHMTTMGTISLSQATYEALLTDIGASLKAHGFDKIFFIGDSGGNMKAAGVVSQKLSDAKTIAAVIPEYYNYDDVEKLLRDKGVLKQKDPNEGLHDSVGITLNILASHPSEVRLDERIKTNTATLAGVSFADKAANQKLAQEVIAFRTKVTVDAIKKVIAAKGQAK